MKIPINRELVPFYGDWDTAAFITQLLYWQERAGKTDGWVYKTYEEWEEEVKVKRLALIERVKRLEKLYLEKQVKMFNGKKRTGLRVNIGPYLVSLDEYFNTMQSKV